MSNKALVYTISLITLLIGLTASIMPFIVPVEVAVNLIREDNVVEYANALFFLIAGIIFLMIFFMMKSGNKFGKFKTSRNIFYLGLAILFIFGAGEEISWGQRIFGYETPASIAAVNMQGEFTLHNLPMFDPNNESLVNMNRLFHLFWLSFGIIIPGIALLSKRTHDWLSELGMPIAPILLGIQFLLFYILSKLYTPLGLNAGDYNYRLPEIREAQHAFIFAMIALTLFLYALNERKQHEAARLPG